jgi:hypothetical protein
VQQKDYLEFKERMEGMPARLPPVEANGEWSEMMDKAGRGVLVPRVEARAALRRH